LLSTKDNLSALGNKRQYQNFHMKIRVLLRYALFENDYKEFTKSIEELAESDGYQEITQTNFPFLSHYHLLQKTLLENFIPNLLRDIAGELEDTLEAYDTLDLKYEVTDRFLIE
jgi:hypothetical protein